MLALWAFTQIAQAQQPSADIDIAGNPQVAEIIRTFQGRGVQADESTPTPAKEAVERFQLREGIQIELVAAEPVISQPLFLSWDSRGRLWVVQYRQYQYPAGLKVIRYDQHLRAVFDKVPQPPPYGTQGADRITVFEDTNGDGKYDAHKDVITGLNIATAVQVGRGGIWVLNPPYLLFYPDANGDDIPDADPEVHLSGFGLQDTHSVANSMIWGPDGWLYGANGSTTVGNVSSQVTKGVHFQGQCIWRYNPSSQVFEIYAEGGGNTFSLDIDAHGRVFSGTNGGGTRGFYYPQGSYSHKNWGKHGPLTNPYAFGYFDGMPSKGDTRRFPQAFLIYEGGLFPTSLARTIVAPNAMQNLVWNSRLLPWGSTYRTVDEQNLLRTNDRWFRPVYAGVGPDGAIYLADWYDTRLSHVSPIDNWHKTSGRIYRLTPGHTDQAGINTNLRELSSGQLISHFAHSNKWHRRRAALELGWRNDPNVVPTLVQQVNQHASLEALWALSIMEELHTLRAVRWLEHHDPHIRRWVIRLLGDRHEGHPNLAEIAQSESEVQVRSQLAATAKRIPAEDALPLIKQLLLHHDDSTDPHLPLMLWWALEAHADRFDAVASLFSESSFWQRPIIQRTILPRLMRRYAMQGTTESLTRCARLLEIAPDQTCRESLLVGFNEAFQGRSLPTLPAVLDDALTKYQQSRQQSAVVLGLRRGDDKVVDQAIALIENAEADLGLRLEVARVLGEVRLARAVPPLLKLASGRGTENHALQRVALQSLAAFEDDRIPQTIIPQLGAGIPDEHGLRASAIRTLASRPDWALSLLLEISEWRLRKEDVPADVAQRLRSLPGEQIQQMVVKALGPDPHYSSAEKAAAINELLATIDPVKGTADRGQILFAKHCGTCHQLYGTGETVGPPLDAYDRGNLKFWLTALVEPSLEIREGYQSYLVITKSGRAITGVISAQDDQSVTVRTAEHQQIVIPRTEIDELQAIETSLMPDNLLVNLNESERNDLFAYLMLGTRK